MIQAPPDPEHCKSLGAYYTSPEVAEFLVAWGIRSAGSRVLDPSFGGGVFLSAAAARISKLGGGPADAVWGIEFNREAHTSVSRALVPQLGLDPTKLICADFFSIQRDQVPTFTSIVGNPPFIRYQQFSAESRANAKQMLAAHGIRLSELASSWAPFVVHSTELLAEGGHLGMVVPMELCHAAYAKDVLDHLTRSFRKLTLLTFRSRLFPHLSQDTLLLLGEQRGNHQAQIVFRAAQNVSSLREFTAGSARVPGIGRAIDSSFIHGDSRFVEQFLPKKARNLYEKLRGDPRVRRLGELADVGIGYVTGANDFFHLSPSEYERLELPLQYAKRAVFRGRAFAGLQFTNDDWLSAASNGHAGLLLALPTTPLKTFPAALKRYLGSDVAVAASSAFKCRSRSPWYAVPHIHLPDAFLTYMNGAFPQLVLNAAHVVAPNTLHIVRLRPLISVSAPELAVAWQTSLTRLSVEIEGHAMGGGMLKLEPSEAAQVLVASPTALTGIAESTARVLDRLLRVGRADMAQAAADNTLLQMHLGLTAEECRSLQRATQVLRASNKIGVNYRFAHGVV